MNEDDLIEDLKDITNLGRASDMRPQLKSVIQDLQEGEYNESGSDQE
jgi:hypothetical protein